MSLFQVLRFSIISLGISCFIGVFGMTMAPSSYARSHQEFVVGHHYSGFELKRVEKVSEISGQAYFFEHLKTKAPLLYLFNQDDNKTFGIAFKTPPQDSTGVFHVFEHSVLGGSKRFPIKSLFFEVNHSSVNTFQNAMTYSDKTFYPVASTNPQDFKNLVRIYLDAVFFPLVVQDERIFRREGWHYELTKNNDLVYNGIVFSEMKGAYSNPSRLLYKTIQSTLLPNSPYAYDSGGDPEHIPGLTFSQIQKTHKEYYHPANSSIFFYGNGNIREHLKLVEGDYLSQFSMKQDRVQIAMGSPLAGPVIVKKSYPASPTENLKTKTFHSRNFALPHVPESKIFLSQSVFTAALGGFEGSPLKQELIESKVCLDVDVDFDFLQKTIFSIICRGSEPDLAEKFNKIVDKVLAKVGKEGFNSSLVHTAFNKVEFDIREYKSIHRGLTLADRVLQSQLYGGDPLAYVRYEGALKELRSEIEKKDFGSKMAQTLLSTREQAQVTLRPEAGLLEKTEAENKVRMAQLKEKMDESQLKKEIEEFKAWNQAPVAKKDLKKIPKLSIRDLNRKNKVIRQIQTEKEGIVFLEHPVESQGIAYMSLYFDLHRVPSSLVPYLPILTEVMGKFDTKKHTYKDLELELYKYVGGLEASVALFEKKNNASLFEKKFRVNLKASPQNLEPALNLVREIFLETQLSSEKRMAQLQDKYQSDLDVNIAFHAMAYARINSRAQARPSAQYENLVAGVPQLLFARQLGQEKKYKETLKNLEALSRLIFVKENLVVGLACDEKLCEQVRSTVASFVQDWPQKQDVQVSLSQLVPRQLSQENGTPSFDGVGFPSQVQYFSLYSILPSFADRAGELKVASNYVNNSYLHPKLREQGGAYGGGMWTEFNGGVGLFTYRDPRASESIADLRGVGKFLETLSDDQKKIESAIIGTIGDMDLPRTAPGTAAQAISWYFQGVTQKDLQKIRDQVFAISTKKLNQLGRQLIPALNNQAYLSGAGGKDKLQSALELKKLIQL